MNEIRKYEFDGRAIEFAPRSEGRIGATTRQVADFYGVTEATVQDVHRKSDGEFRPTETWVEIAVSPDRNDSGHAGNPRRRPVHTDRLYDPYGALRVGMKLRKSDRAVKTRDFILYTIIPEWIAMKSGERAQANETIRLLGNALADKSKLVDVAGNLGKLASQMFEELKRQRADERAATTVDAAGGDLFTGSGALTDKDNAVLAALAVSGPQQNFKTLAKAARITQRDTALSCADLAARGLIRRDGGKITLAPQGDSEKVIPMSPGHARHDRASNPGEGA